jgi:hypothetical protein
MAEKGVQVNATVPKEWDQKLEDHRWSVRMTKTQVVRKAVEEYMVNHGLLTNQDQGEAQPDTA